MSSKKQKTSPSSGKGAVLKQQKMWDEIQRKREENRRARKKKITIIAVLVIIALVAAAVLIGFLVKKNGSAQGGDNPNQVITGLSPKEGAQKKDIAAMRGFLLGPKGLWSYSEGAPTVETFYSYGCPGCIGLESKVGQELTKLAEDGKINLIYHPVSTHPTAWEGVATDAALKVAKDDPQHFVALHHKLMEAGFSIMYASEETLRDQGNSGVMADPNKSLETVKKAAKEAGVAPAVIDSFQPVRSDKLPIVQWGQEWSSTISSKVPGAQAATPTFFRNGSEAVDTNSWYENKDSVLPSLVKK